MYLKSLAEARAARLRKDPNPRNVRWSVGKEVEDNHGEQKEEKSDTKSEDESDGNDLWSSSESEGLFEVTDI